MPCTNSTILLYECGYISSAFPCCYRNDDGSHQFTRRRYQVKRHEMCSFSEGTESICAQWARSSACVCCSSRSDVSFVNRGAWKARDTDAPRLIKLKRVGVCCVICFSALRRHIVLESMPFRRKANQKVPCASRSSIRPC